MRSEVVPVWQNVVFAGEHFVVVCLKEGIKSGKAARAGLVGFGFGERGRIEAGAGIYGAIHIP